MTIQQALQRSKIKRSTYFVLIAVVALLVSGTLTLLLSKPQWKTSFSYQYLEKEGKTQGATTLSHPSDLSKTQEFGSSDPVAAQMAVLSSDKFLNDIQAGLEREGLQGWTTEDLSKAIKVTNPLRSNLIRVEVQTPDKAATQRIALLLDDTYTKYTENLYKEIVEKERAFVQNSLKRTRQRLADGEKNIREMIAADGQPQAKAFANDPNLGSKALMDGYQNLSQKIKDVETVMAMEETKYKSYRSLLNRDEKTLMEGVVLGEDPVILKLTEQLATAQTDAGIHAVKLGPADTEAGEVNARVRSLEKLLDAQEKKLLGSKGSPKPIIRDSLRKGFIEELLASKIRLEAAVKEHKNLSAQRDELLKKLDGIINTVGDYNAWLLQKNMLQDTVATLEKRLDDLDYQLFTLEMPVKPFGKIPSRPSQVHNFSQGLWVFVSTFSGLFCLMGAVPFALDFQSSLIPHRSILNVMKDLLKTKGQKIIVLMPVYSSGHLNASLHLGGLLNQFGRDAIVMDVDLSNRLLSRKMPEEHLHGILEHLLELDMKKPYQDPLSGAKVIPLETTLPAEKVVEFSQVIQRIPKIWQRWSASVIILDISKWHEAYHQLLPFVSEVIFYVPPAHKVSTLLPKVFKGKYNVPVSLVEIQPDM